MDPATPRQPLAVAAFEGAGGGALRLPGGEFVDLPVAQRARRLLELAATLS